MSIHKSLRTGSGLSKHRNVFKRSERIKILEEAGEWREGQSGVLGLRKVKSLKVTGKKKAAKKEEAAEGAGAAPAKAGAPAGAKAPAAAAPAAKGAAPKK